jgi:hypothetical protein
MEEIAQRGRDMSKFKVGDRVRIIGKNNTCLPLGSIHVVSESDSSGCVFVKDGCWSRWCLSDEVLKLIEEKEMPDTEKKYKIATELSLQEVTDLKRALIFASGFVELHAELNIIFKEAQRKVVKVGDKEYYEDELATALANIKPIK